MPLNKAAELGRNQHPRPNFVTALAALFFRPSTFFDRYVDALTLGTCWFALVVVGTQVFFEIREIKTPIVSAFVRALPLGRAIWLDWLVVLAVGGVVGVVVLFLFSWWFEQRLGLSGISYADKRGVRRVTLFVNLVAFMPLFAGGVARAIQGGFEIAAKLQPWTALLLIFPLWSCWTTYVAARMRFGVRRDSAIVWFLIVPLILTLWWVWIQFKLALAVNILAPDVDRFMEYKSDWASFRYPGNWRLVESPTTSASRSHAIKHSVLLTCGSFASASILICDDPFDLEKHWREVADQLNLQNPTVGAELSKWRNFAGKGFGIDCMRDERPTGYLTFSAQLENGDWLVVDEVMPKSVYEILKPGFALIRKTLTLHGPQPPPANP